MIIKKKINYGIFLLSAGYGKRLRPLTLDMPKALIKINEKPILENWLDIFNNFMYPPSEILINTHYQADKIKQFYA